MSKHFGRRQGITRLEVAALILLIGCLGITFLPPPRQEDRAVPRIDPSFRISDARESGSPASPTAADSEYEMSDDGAHFLTGSSAHFIPENFDSDDSLTSRALMRQYQRLLHRNDDQVIDEF